MKKQDLSTLNQVAQDYDTSRDFDAVNTALASRLITPQCRDKKVLEIGCGKGEMTGDLLAVAQSVSIVEAAPSYCELVRAKWGNSLQVYQTQIEDFSCESRFDVIVMASLLHHLPEPASVIRRLTDYLSPTGKIIASVPHAGSLHRRLGVKAGLLKSIYDDSERNTKFHQFHKFDKATLCQVFQAAGLRVESCFGYMLKPFSSEQMQRLKLDEKMIEALYQMGAEFEEFSSQMMVQAIV